MTPIKTPLRHSPAPRAKPGTARAPTAKAPNAKPPTRQPLGTINVGERRTTSSRVVYEIEPHLQARRQREGRSRFRRYLIRGLVLAALAAAAVGGWVFVHSSLLSARVIHVTGASLGPRQRASVLTISGLSTHPPLIDVDPGRVSARIQRLPWAGAVSVTRDWPDGVTVAVHVRKPVAAMRRSQGGFALVDRSGRVLGHVPSASPNVVPLQAPVGPVAVGRWVPPAASPGLTVAASLPPALVGQVASVVVEQQGQVNLQLTSPLTVQLGTASELHQKYEDAASILASATLQAGDVVDVSVPASPAVSSSPAGAK